MNIHSLIYNDLDLKKKHFVYVTNKGNADNVYRSIGVAKLPATFSVAKHFSDFCQYIKGV